MSWRKLFGKNVGKQGAIRESGITARIPGRYSARHGLNPATCLHSVSIWGRDHLERRDRTAPDVLGTIAPRKRYIRPVASMCATTLPRFLIASILIYYLHYDISLQLWRFRRSPISDSLEDGLPFGSRYVCYTSMYYLS